jgi:glutamate synthase (NADPH/NADH) small chain
VAQFIRKIATGNLTGSARTIFDANILGASCARVCPVEVLCAGACVMHQLHREPIAIGKLQRYATDAAMKAGTRFFESGKDTGKSVGLIGGGPASLACAHELRRHGHRVTIYEKSSHVGGLNVTGVAPHKMRADTGLEEANWVLAIGGIEVQKNCTIGKDVSFQELEKRHDAVFVGVGLGADSLMNVPGENLAGVYGAVAWIEKLKLGRVDATVKSCLVIGGGNTAIDAVREARTLGIPDVRLVYRGTQAVMSGYEHEWEAAQLQGAQAEWHAVPVAYEGTGKVQKVRCLRTDEKKKPIPGSEFTLDADLVLIAIGQGTLGQQLAALEGVKVEKGRLVADATGKLGRKGWYGGGDCVNGGKEVVNAAAEGKAAAKAIDAYLTGAAHA